MIGYSAIDAIIKSPRLEIGFELSINGLWVLPVKPQR